MGAAEELWAGRAQLHSFAGAEEVEGSLLLGYMEQAAKKVQDALTSVQESEMAVQARYAYWCSSPASSPPPPPRPFLETPTQRPRFPQFTQGLGLSEPLLLCGAFSGYCG